MELYDAMRTTFAAREYTGDEVDDATVYRILDHARFAPSGGNRQGWKVIVVRDDDTRHALARLVEAPVRRYVAERNAGETPWNAVHPSRVSETEAAATAIPASLIAPLLDAAVLLVVCVDLELVASVDRDLDRVGIATGASIYPFVWNVLLAARNEGCGGVLTTFAAAVEPDVQRLLALPEHVAVAAVVPLGRPARRLTRLRRNPVESFAVLERWGGEALRRPT